MERDSRKIKARLESEGWVLARVSGSHHIFKHAERGLISLPHPKELKPGIARAIARQAGW